MCLQAYYSIAPGYHYSLPIQSARSMKYSLLLSSKELPLLIQRDLLFSLLPNHLNQFCMLWRPHTDIALKRLRDSHPARYHLAPRIKRLSTHVLLRDVEAPDNPTDVQVQGFLCNVHARADSSPCSIGEVVPLIWICDVEVGGGGEIITQVAFGFEFEGRLPALGVVVDMPDLLALPLQARRGTYHQLMRTTEPLGMNFPSYQSSSVVEWCIPTLFGGRILNNSLMMALI